jgi:hypothetical protein
VAELLGGQQLAFRLGVAPAASWSASHLTWRSSGKPSCVPSA